MLSRKNGNISKGVDNKVVKNTNVNMLKTEVNKLDKKASDATTLTLMNQ